MIHAIDYTNNYQRVIITIYIPWSFFIINKKKTLLKVIIIINIPLYKKYQKMN